MESTMEWTRKPACAWSAFPVLFTRRRVQRGRLADFFLFTHLGEPFLLLTH